ncbi:hypothetical protein V8F20_006845 [Naviculisporaceae sp. PSN 640]
MDVNNLQQEQDQGCNDATLSCMICTGDNPVEDTFQSPCEQRCPYCRDCLQRHYTLSFKEEGLFPPKCCGQTIPIEAAIPFLTKEVLQTYSDKIIEYGTPHDKRMYCHVSTCSQFIPTSVPEHDGVKACPSCKEKTCTLCNKAEHPGEEWCPNDDASSERLAELAKAKEWQTCPKCRAVVELVVGCNHIVCTCGAEFCYVCASPWPTCECEMFREPDEDEEDEDFGYYDPPGPFQGRNREEFWGINIANGELRGGVREWYRVGHEAGRYRRHFTTLYPEPAQARQQYHQTLGEQHEAADQDLYGHHPGPSYRDETRPVPEEVVPFNRAIDPSRALRGRGSMYYPVPAWSLRPSQEELAEERLAYRHYRLAVPDVPTVVHRPIATDEQSPEPQQQEDNDSEVGGLQLPQHLLHRLQQQQQEDNDSEKITTRRSEVYNSHSISYIVSNSSNTRTKTETKVKITRYISPGQTRQRKPKGKGKGKGNSKPRKRQKGGVLMFCGGDDQVGRALV